MSEHHRRRWGLLTLAVPELLTEPGTLLYVGAYAVIEGDRVKVARMDYGPDLARLGHEITVLEAHKEALDALKQTRFAKSFAYAVHGNVVDLETLVLPQEHVDAWQFVIATRAMEKRTNKVIICGSPWGWFPEGPEFNNPHNCHRQYMYYTSYAGLKYEVAAFGPKDRAGGNMVAWKRM